LDLWLLNIIAIWNITGTCFVIRFAIIGTKSDDGGTKFDELGTKYYPELIKYRP